MKKDKPIIIFTSPVLRHPPVGGPELRIDNSIKALSQISYLYIYSRISLIQIGGYRGLSFYQNCCKKFYFAPSTGSTNSKFVRFMKRAVNFCSRKIIKKDLLLIINDIQKGDCLEDDFNELLAIANKIKPDIIWLGYGNISYPLLKLIKDNSNYKVVLDTDSVWSRFILRALPYANNKEEQQRIERAGKEKEKEERWGTKMADVTTAVSQVDAEYYLGLARDPQQVHIFSNVINFETYQQVPLPPDNFRKPCIYLAGSFGPRSPMDDAARWINEKVLPLVRQKIPDIHFYIIGTNSDQTLSDVQDPNITITGRLESVLPYLCHINVALVPLRYESGTRFKILEAGACGIPVVSTTLGAEGIHVTHGEDILIADGPNDFAHAIVSLIQNKDFTLQLGKNLKKLVERRYSINTLTEQGQKILDYIGIKHDRENQLK